MKRANSTDLKEIVKYMKEHGSITPEQGRVDLGCARVPARIYDLKHLGYGIGTRRIEVPTRWKTTTWSCEYWIIHEPEGIVL